VGLGWTFHALSLGYFSLCEQRKVTRAPQAIGSLAGDSSLKGARGERDGLDPGLRRDDEQEQDQDGFQLSLE